MFPDVAKVGASLTGLTTIVKVFVVVSRPPFAVPPSSCTCTVTWAEPFASGAAV